MNRKMIKGKNIKTKHLDFFQAKQNTASADSISLYYKYTTLKCRGTRQNVREHKGKHVYSSRNNKTWQRLAGTPKQPPKSKAQIALGQLGSTSIHL